MIQQLPRLCMLSTQTILLRRCQHVPALLPKMLHSCLFHLSRITSQASKPAQKVNFKSQGLSCVWSKQLSSVSRTSGSVKKAKGVKSSADKRDEVCQVFDQSDMLVGQMTVQAAEDLAKKDNLRLVDLGENSDRLRSFKLMSGRELAEASKRQRAERKSERVKEKEFRVVSNITDHDLEVKVRQARDVLSKGVHIKFVIKAHRKSSETESNKMISQMMKKITSDLQDSAVIKQGVRTAAEQQLQLKPLSTTQPTDEQQ